MKQYKVVTNNKTIIVTAFSAILAIAHLIANGAIVKGQPYKVNQL